MRRKVEYKVQVEHIDPKKKHVTFKTTVTKVDSGIVATEGEAKILIPKV